MQARRGVHRRQLPTRHACAGRVPSASLARATSGSYSGSLWCHFHPHYLGLDDRVGDAFTDRVLVCVGGERDLEGVCDRVFGGVAARVREWERLCVTGAVCVALPVRDAVDVPLPVCVGVFVGDADTDAVPVPDDDPLLVGVGVGVTDACTSTAAVAFPPTKVPLGRRVRAATSRCAARRGGLDSVSMLSDATLGHVSTPDVALMVTPAVGATSRL